MPIRQSFAGASPLLKPTCSALVPGSFPLVPQSRGWRDKDFFLVSGPSSASVLGTLGLSFHIYKTGGKIPSLEGVEAMEKLMRLGSSSKGKTELQAPLILFSSLRSSSQSYSIPPHPTSVLEDSGWPHQRLQSPYSRKQPIQILLPMNDT